MNVRIALPLLASIALAACGNDMADVQVSTSGTTDRTGGSSSGRTDPSNGSTSTAQTTDATGGSTTESSLTDGSGPDGSSSSSESTTTSSGSDSTSSGSPSTGDTERDTEEGSSSSGEAQDVCFPWRRQFADEADTPHRLQAVGVDASGAIYTGGVKRGPLGELPAQAYTDGFVAKFSADGNLDWTEIVLAQLFEQVRDIELMPDGSVAVHARISDASNFDTSIRGLDSSGDVVWLFESPVSPTGARGSSLAVCPDGTVRIGRHRGIEDGPGANTVAGVVALDTEGNALWVTEVGTRTTAGLVGCAPSGASYLMGTADVDFDGVVVQGRDILVARIDAEGNEEWARRYGSAGTDWPAAMAIGGDDDVFLANVVPNGEVFEGVEIPDAQSLAFLRLDAVGDVTAVAPLGSGGFDRVTDMSLSPNEEVIAVSGRSNFVDLGDDGYESSWAVELVSPTGESLGLLEDPDPTANTAGYAVTFADDLSVIVAGAADVENAFQGVTYNDGDPERSLLVKACLDLDDA